MNVFDVTTNSIVNLGLNILYKNGELYTSIEDARKIISLDDYYKYVSLDKNNCYHFEIISSTHNTINELGKSYAIDDVTMWSLWETIKWKLSEFIPGGKTGDEYIHDFKIQWIHSYREIIKDVSDKYDIPALVLAGVLYVEVGGQPPIFDDGVYYIRDNFIPEVVDGIADIIQMPRLSGEAIRTSFGDISMQIRVAAEVMDYPDPNDLSDGEIDAIIESLKTPEIGLFICAKHLRDLKNVDFQNLSKDELTDEQIRIITTRYNRGAGRTLEEILNNTDYGDRIINNKSAILDALE